jgi:hypothetical protein
MKARVLQLSVSVFLLAIGIAAIAAVSTAMTEGAAGNRDFIAYWAAGQQLVHGANPYGSKGILRLEHAEEFTGPQPLIMRNPPLAFFLAWPLGFVNARVGMMLWLLFLVASLLASIRMLWALHGRPKDRLHLLGYVFAPVLACIMAGQLGIVLLLGLVLFLYFLESRPFLAGAALLLCAVKPHLFLPFGLVLLVWAFWSKAYAVLAGAGTTISASCALSLILDHRAWPQYARMMSAAGIQHEFVPSLSLLFRVAIDHNAVWLQFMPMTAACAWSLWYFWTRRDHWDWMDHGMLLLLVSVATAPYAWFTDEVVVLPAMLAALYRAHNSGRSLFPFGFASGFALVQVMEQVKLTSCFYLWTVPAWIGWYLYATWGERRPFLVSSKLRRSNLGPAAPIPKQVEMRARTRM